MAALSQEMFHLQARGQEVLKRVFRRNLARHLGDFTRSYFNARKRVFLRFSANDLLGNGLKSSRTIWHGSSETVVMANMVASSEGISRNHLRRIQVILEKDGDDRLARVLDEYDTTRFTLSWVTCVGSSVLLTLFVRSAYLGHGLDCFILVLTGGLIGLLYRVVTQCLSHKYNQRIHGAIPEDLRWYLRQSA